MVVSNWTSGSLAFWRNNPLYSERTKDYFEETLKAWVSREKNLASIQSNIKSV